MTTLLRLFISFNPDFRLEFNFGHSQKDRSATKITFLGPYATNFYWPINSEGFYRANFNESPVNRTCHDDIGVEGDPLAQILVISTGLLGIFLLFLGFIRDFVAYGLCRLVCYTLLATSYFMMIIAKPGQSDYLLYVRDLTHINIKFKFSTDYFPHWNYKIGSVTAWVLHYAAGIGLLLNGLQFFGLYPKYAAFLTGICNSLLALCSLVPQLWLKLIIKWNLLSYHTVLIIWLTGALVSLVIGTLIMPWNNMPQVEVSNYRRLFKNYNLKPFNSL